MAGTVIGNLVASLLVMAPPRQPALVQFLVQAGDGTGDATKFFVQGTVRMQGSEATGSPREAALQLVEITVQPPPPSAALRCVPECPGISPQLLQLTERAPFGASRVPGVVAGVAQQACGQLIEPDGRVQDLLPGAVDRRHGHAFRPVRMSGGGRKRRNQQ